MPKYAEEILAAVTELQRHPTAEQVFLEMKREHPSIALGTVYKHLNGLAGEALCPAYNALLENVSLCVYDRATDAAYLLKMDI
jgi:Fe2+ or Zn2+ uptake regulation protein